MWRRLWGRFVTWVRASVEAGAVDRTPAALTDQERAYVSSYVWLRIAVGAVGIALPVILWIGEATVLDAPLHARDSLSSYYHSPMRDWFVCSLAVIGVLLITYMVGAWKNFEFWVSSTAGLALLGVAFFPTERSNLPKGAPPCEVSPKPSDCTDLEHRLGEVTTGNIHLTFAAIALALLAVIAFLFAARATSAKDHWGSQPAAGSVPVWVRCGDRYRARHRRLRTGVHRLAAMGADTAVHRRGRNCLRVRALLDRTGPRSTKVAEKGSALG